MNVRNNNIKYYHIHVHNKYGSILLWNLNIGLLSFQTVVVTSSVRLKISFHSGISKNEQVTITTTQWIENTGWHGVCHWIIIQARFIHLF